MNDRPRGRRACAQCGDLSKTSVRSPAPAPVRGALLPAPLIGVVMEGGHKAIIYFRYYDRGSNADHEKGATVAPFL